MMKGCYGIVNEADGTKQGQIALAKKLSSVCCALQVRIKTMPAGALLSLCHALRSVTSSIPLIINDRLDIALACGADGVHLGQDDLSIDQAKTIVTNHQKNNTVTPFLIGISTHTIEQAKQAVSCGADYIGFGPVFDSATKPEAGTGKGLILLEQVVQAVAPVPVVAIGGVTITNIDDVVSTGVHAACSITFVNNDDDPQKAALTIASAWNR